MLFDLARERLEADLPMRYGVTVGFSGARGQPEEPLRYIVDMGYMYGTHYVDVLGEHHAAKALQGV